MSVSVGPSFSYDETDQSFYSGQSTINRLIDLITETAELYKEEIDKLNNLKDSSTVGYETDLDYKVPSQIINSDIDKYKMILANATNVRDLILYYNKDDEWQKYGLTVNPKIIFSAAKGQYSLDNINPGYNKAINYSEIEKDGYVVQGLTYVETKDGTKVLITAHASKDGPSRLYVFDYKKGISEKLFILNNKDHVGGVTYDKKNDVLWIAGDKGTVHTYNFTRMNNITKTHNKLFCEKIYTIDLNKPNAANNRMAIEIPNDIDARKVINFSNHKQSGMDSLYFHDNKLYSNTYGYKGQLIETKINYAMDNNGNITNITSNNSGKVIAKLDGATQGLAFYEDRGKTYVVTASSAAGSKSRLTKWEIKDSEVEKIGKYYFDQSGLEGIAVHNNQVKGIFEYDTQTSTRIANTDSISEAPDAVTDQILAVKAWVWDNLHK